MRIASIRLSSFVLLLLPVTAAAQSEPLPTLPSDAPPPGQAPAAPATATPPPPPPPPPPMVTPVVTPETTSTGCIKPPGAYRHDGFYLRFASGLGCTSLAGTGPAASSSVSGAGSVGMIGIGGTLGRGLVLGVGVLGASTSGDFHGAPSSVRGSVSGTVGSFGFLIDWFPSPEGGWHVGTILGVGGPSLMTDEGLHWAGFSPSAALIGGYDWWIGEDWSLGLTAIVSGATSAQVKDSDDSNKDTGYQFGATSFGIGASLLYH